MLQRISYTLFTFDQFLGRVDWGGRNMHGNSKAVNWFGSSSDELYDDC